MIKSVTIEVTFPCSEETWKRVLTIRSLAGSVQVAQSMPQQIQTLSDNEEAALRALNGTDSESPVLDMLAKHGLGGKVNMTQACVDYVKAHPGCTMRECVSAVGTEYNLDQSKLTCLVHTLSYSKRSQRKFDKVNGCLYLHVQG